MAVQNVVDAFVEVLLDTALDTELNAVKYGRGSLLDLVHRDTALDRVGVEASEVKIWFPEPVSFADAHAGNVGYTERRGEFKSIRLEKSPTIMYKWTESELLAISKHKETMKQRVIDPTLKAAYEFIAADLGSRLTTTNFATYTPVASVTNNTVRRAQIKDAFKLMAAQKVDTQQKDRFFCVVPQVVYLEMSDHADFAEHQITGDPGAIVRTTGLIDRQMGVQIVQDFWTPQDTSPARYRNILMAKEAISLVIRPPEAPSSAPHISTSFLEFEGVPVRMMMTYDFDERAYVTSFDYLYGIKVFRPDLGCLIYSNIA